MISRSSLGRVQQGLRTQCLGSATSRRGLAAAASGSFSYETGENSGVKFASRDLPGPTTSLAVIAKASTRYQTAPGLTEGLEKFAFKSTERRSALRITREAELLGGELTASHSRENLVIGARFLRDDLPYFAELLSEVVTQTRYMRHELDEDVLPNIKLAQKDALRNVNELAFNSAHGVAFHRGLGNPLHPTSSTPLTKYLTADDIWAYSQAAYASPNIAVVANGADHAELSKWMKEFFSNVAKSAPADAPKITSEPSKYHGGEERIAHDGGNSLVIGFPGSSTFTGGSWKPEIAVLAALLGGQSSIKWSPGFSLLAKATAGHTGVHINTLNLAYSDAGLFCVNLTGSAAAIRSASQEVVKTIKSVSKGEISKEDFKKAVANAKFQTLSSAQDTAAGIELTGSGLIQGGKAHQFDEVAKSIEGVSEAQLKTVAKTLLEGKASVSAVGDLFLLPFAEELGLHA